MYTVRPMKLKTKKLWLEKIAKLTNNVGLQKIIKQRNFGLQKNGRANGNNQKRNFSMHYRPSLKNDGQ